MRETNIHMVPDSDHSTNLKHSDIKMMGINQIEKALNNLGQTDRPELWEKWGIPARQIYLETQLEESSKKRHVEKYPTKAA